MTSPLIVTFSELEASLAYMGEVVAVLRNTTRPVGNPVITRAEYAAMGHARTMGLSPAGMAARLIAADRRGGA